jgi:nicotinamidase-related amidase
MLPHPMPPYPMIVGQPVLLAINIQQGGFTPGSASGIPHMVDHPVRMRRACSAIDTARAAEIPVVFFHEAHRRSMVDFGRELDGSECVHCLEGDPAT